MSSQINGLLIKNFQLISRQKGTLICQIITPLFCLGFIALIKLIVETQLTKNGFNIQIEFPVVFNMPFNNKANFTKDTLRIDTCDQWYLYGFNNKTANSSDKEFFGQNKGLPVGKSDSSGILISQKNLLQNYCESMKRMTPYFKEVDKGKTINQQIFDAINSVDNLNFNQLKNFSSIQAIPDGAYEINKINENEFSYKIQVDDHKLPQYHRGNGITKFEIYNKAKGGFSPYIDVIAGVLSAADLINKAYFKHFFDDYFFVSSVQLMPVSTNTNEYIQRIINVAGSTFYPIAISLLMPLFMYTIVLEKEGKLIEIMKINGLKMRNYWLTNFIFNFIIYVVTIIIFNIVGLSLGLTMFTQTNFFLLFFVYLGWGFCQIGVAFFFQAFLTNPKSATIIGYIISLWTTIFACSLNATLWESPSTMPFLFNLYPTFSICRIMYYLTTQCGYATCYSSLSGLPTELKTCIIMLFIMPWILGILGIYLYEVIPQQFGIRKHPLFFIPYFTKENKNKKKVKVETEEVMIKENEINFTGDQDIIDDTNTIKNLGDNKKGYPLICENLTKVYQTDTKVEKKALKNFNLLLRNDEIFGLLGPNGAGKTTFFSLLTGIYEPSDGNAWVGGNSIKTQIEKVQQCIGYCPQFDILWNELTVEEHLYFYSKLKNVERGLAKENVEKTLEDTKLKPFRNFLVKELSGGMKRRLSLGISLVGNPSIVFLDEPTTGLDPENKRQIWDILSNCKSNKCMILTTHLMEEAEVLTDRIGIIVQGQLKCMGTQYKLKRIYGRGFKLVVNLNNESIFDDESGLSQEEKMNEIIKFIKEVFSMSLVKDKFKNTIVFQIQNEEFDAEKLFNAMEERKKDLFINNWAISQVTLEDIFIDLTENEL